MRAGTLDRFVTLQHRTLGAVDAYGATAETYAQYAQVWAGKRELSGQEGVTARVVGSSVTTLFRIRYRSDVVATDRLICDGVTYELVAPAVEIGKRDGLELLARALRV